MQKTLSVKVMIFSSLITVDLAKAVANEQKLEGIYQPDGRVIMGRSQDIDTEEAKQRWKHLKSEQLAVDTYDDVVAKVRELAKTLDSILLS